MVRKVSKVRWDQKDRLDHKVRLAWVCLSRLSFSFDCSVDSLQETIDNIPWGTPANITLRGMCVEPQINIIKSNISIAGEDG